MPTALHQYAHAFCIALSLCLVGNFSSPSPALAQQNVVVLLDDSGSMNDRMRTAKGREKRINVAKSALKQVLGQLPEDCRVGVLALNSKVSGSNWVIPFGSGTPSEWQQNIQKLQANGGTPLGEFMKYSADTLMQARAKQVYGEYRLLVVTDGEANDRNLVESYLPDILSRGIFVDVIGVDMQQQHSLATRVHRYRSANDAAALQTALSEVFAETTLDDQDASDDFGILAGLPDGFAEQAIAAMSARGNSPIGEVNQQQFRPAAASSSAVNSPANAFPNPANSNTPAMVPGQASGSVRSGLFSIAFGGVFCCFGGIVLVVIVASIVFSSGRRRR